MPRQQCPKGYQQNGLIDIIRSQHVLDNGDLYGAKPIGFVVPKFGDIDSNKDFETVAVQVKKNDRFMNLQRWSDFMK